MASRRKSSRTKRKTERVFDKDFEERMARRGERFGRRAARWGREFGDEMRDWGEDFGESVRRDENGRCRNAWHWHHWTPLGLAGPLIGSVIGLFFVALGLWLLNWLNGSIGSGFLTALIGFLARIFPWIAAAFLLFGYADYFFRHSRLLRFSLKPVVDALGFTAFVWLASDVLLLANAHAPNAILAGLAGFLHANLAAFFVLLLFLGYVLSFFRALFWWRHW